MRQGLIVVVGGLGRSPSSSADSAKIVEDLRTERGIGDLGRAPSEESHRLVRDRHSTKAERRSSRDSMPLRTNWPPAAGRNCSPRLHSVRARRRARRLDNRARPGAPAIRGFHRWNRRDGVTRNFSRGLSGRHWPPVRPPVAESPARCAASGTCTSSWFDAKPSTIVPRARSRNTVAISMRPICWFRITESSVPFARPSSEPKFTVTIPSSMERMVPSDFGARLGARVPRKRERPRECAGCRALVSKIVGGADCDFVAPADCAARSVAGVGGRKTKKTTRAAAMAASPPISGQLLRPRN